METIGSGAFYGCSSFEGDLIIPSSVTMIGGGAFNGAGFTGTLKVGMRNIPDDKYPFSGCKCTKLVLEDTVETIGTYAFAGLSTLTGDLIIPNSVKDIKDFAFVSCSGFTGNLTILSSVTAIGDSAFAGCSGFTGNLTIPSSVKTIKRYAFANCSSLANIIIKNPESEVTIEENAFSNTVQPQYKP